MPDVDLTRGGDLAEATDLRELLEPTDAPCISIYMPTSRLPSEADINRIRYKNQLRAVESSLGLREQQRADHSDLLAPLLELVDHIGFWSAQYEGFAAFRSPRRLWLRRLLYPVPELAVVATSFHVKPLIRLVQKAGRYQVLCVSVDRIALYEGDRFTLDEVPLHPDVPRNMAEAIGEPGRVTKTRRTIYDQGETDPRDAQLRRYFRRLDDAIWEHHSRRANLPLILAALPEYHGFFHDASHNTLLLAGVGIKRDPFKDITPRQLTELAWQAVEPAWRQRITDLHDRYGNATGHGKASDQIVELGRLVAGGKIGTLLLEESRHIGGTFDPATGQVQRKSLSDPAVDDVLDDLAEAVLDQAGDVLVLPPDQMPTDTGIAGIQRF